MSKKFEAIILACVLVLAFILRIWNYDEFPVYSETQDEVAWTWLGSSLLKEGVPSAWSQFPAYKDYKYKVVQGFDPIVRPFLDHPPLFSLIPGVAHLARGTEWSQPPSARVIRFPMLLIGVLNVFLLYLLCKKMFPLEKYIALGAPLVFATAPLFVFSSRLVLAENFLTTVLSVVLIVLQMPALKRRNMMLFVLSVAAVLSKVSGILIPLLIIGVGLWNKDKTWKYALAGLVAGVVMFVAYGFAYNGTLFMQIQQSQAGRNIGLATLYNRVILHPAVVDKYFFDGWLIVGLFSVFYILATKNEEKLRPVALYIFLNFLFVSMTAGERTLHAWYDFTIFPLLCIAIVLTVISIINTKKYLLFALMWLFMLPLLRIMLINIEQYYDLGVLMLRGIIALGAVPFGLSLILKNQAVPRKVAYALVALILIANVVSILAFTKETYWGADDYFIFR